MAYFSNGTEGLIYQEEYCFKCVHYRETEEDKKSGSGPGCPIWDLHLFASDISDAESMERQILDDLIPMKDGYPDQCKMFIRKEQP